MRVLLFANTDWYLYNFRMPLLKAIRARGDELTLVSPEGSYSDRLKEKGFRWLRFVLSRSGVNPLAELGALLRLVRLYQRENPELMMHFTIKCVLYGSLAARLLGKNAVINSIDGLGYLFSESDFKARLLGAFVKPLYRFALKNTFILFQNPDDLDTFRKMNMIREGQYALIRGVGIDLEEFYRLQEAEGPPVVAYAGRLLFSKGIAVMVAAARTLKTVGINARFVLVGEPDPGNPESIDRETLRSWEQEGVIEHWGWRDDMQTVYQQVHIFCLPTIFREGLPRSLMEAAACKLPIIASDVPGCREIVHDGINGLLVPPNDVNALADAMRRLIGDAGLRRAMGTKGREIVRKTFSAEDIVWQTLESIDRFFALHSR